MRNVNIIVMGKTGAGKSTLINTVLKEEVAPTGMGQATTKKNQVYTKKLKLTTNLDDKKEICLLTMYDTVGLEINKEVTDRTLSEVKEHIRNSKKTSNYEDINIVWFCINELSERFEPYEIDLIKKLSLEYEIPFIIVLTQSISNRKRGLEKQVNDVLPNVIVLKVLAKDFELDDNHVIPQHGVKELLIKSINDFRKCKVRILEDKIKSLDIIREEQKKNLIKRITEKGEKCIKRHVSKAEKIAIVPIGCIPFVHGICASMILELNEIAGLNIGEEIFSNFLVGLVATPFMGVPLLSIAVASAYVETVGDTYLMALTSVIENATDLNFEDTDEMEERLKEELRRLKDRGKI